MIFLKESNHISSRELEVLKLLMEEKNTAEIARCLQLSHHTIETHRKNLLKKTKTSTLAGLVTYALRNKLT